MPPNRTRSLALFPRTLSGWGLVPTKKSENWNTPAPGEAARLRMSTELFRNFQTLTLVSVDVAVGLTISTPVPACLILSVANWVSPRAEAGAAGWSRSRARLCAH